MKMMSYLKALLSLRKARDMQIHTQLYDDKPRITDIITSDMLFSVPAASNSICNSCRSKYKSHRNVNYCKCCGKKLIKGNNFEAKIHKEKHQVKAFNNESEKQSKNYSHKTCLTKSVKDHNFQSSVLNRLTSTKLSDETTIARKRATKRKEQSSDCDHIDSENKIKMRKYQALSKIGASTTKHISIKSSNGSKKDINKCKRLKQTTLGINKQTQKNYLTFFVDFASTPRKHSPKTSTPVKNTNKHATNC